MLHVIYKDSVYEELVWMQAPSRSRSLSWCPRATNRWWWATRCSSTTRQWAATASWTPVSTRRLWACVVGYDPPHCWRAPRRRGSVPPPSQAGSWATTGGQPGDHYSDGPNPLFLGGGGRRRVVVGWWRHDWVQNCIAIIKFQYL